MGGIPLGEAGIHAGYWRETGGLMKIEPTPYLLYMLLLGFFNILILATPFVMVSSPGAGELLHSGFSLSCHQIASRSYCFYPEDFSFGDCPKEYTRAPVLDSEMGPAYKFPVCARDVPLYLAAFLGGLAVFKTKWRDSRKPPNPLFFVLAIIPIALDGGTQLIGLRESTNELRAITGIIAGFAFSFYFIPMLNAFFLKEQKKK
jgi:uncharacterized membrane protein